MRSSITHEEAAIRCFPLCEINHKKTPRVYDTLGFSEQPTTAIRHGDCEVVHLRGRGFIPTLITTQQKAQFVCFGALYPLPVHIEQTGGVYYGPA